MRRSCILLIVLFTVPALPAGESLVSGWMGAGHWEDGLAEVGLYTGVIVKYGVPRESVMELIMVREHFDLRPKGLVDMLDLKRPIYCKTAAYGHFGRELPEFTWEATDKADALKAAL